MKTITGLFDTYSDAEAAVYNLERAGVPSDDISIVSNNSDGRYNDSNAEEGAGTGAGIGAAVGGTGGLLAGLGLLAIPGVGPVVAAGWLAATAVGAAGKRTHWRRWKCFLPRNRCRPVEAKANDTPRLVKLKWTATEI